MKPSIAIFLAIGSLATSASAWQTPDFALSDVQAGLNKPFEFVARATGATYDITDFGATPGNSADDDAKALRDALAAAKPGDIIQAPAGEYHFKTPVQLKSGVHVIGEGIDETTIVAQLSGSGNYLLFVPSASTEIRLSGIHLTRDGGTEIDDMIEVGTSSGSNAKRIWISDLLIDSHYRRGINVRNAEHVLIEHVTVRDATAFGGGGQGYGINLNNPGNNNNWIRHCTVGPNLRHGILIQYGAYHNLIEYCEGLDTTHDVFDLHGEGEYGNEFRFNRAQRSGGAGFGVGNTGGGPPPHDEAGPYNWIHDNEVLDSHEGAYFRSSEDPTLNTYIERNYFHHNEYGIRLMAAELNSNSSADSTFIRNNIIHANERDGIYAQVTHDLLIEGNFITHNGGDGIDFRSGVRDYIIRNNDLRFNAGIALNAASQVTGEFADSNVTEGAGEAPLFVFAGDAGEARVGEPFNLHGVVVQEGVPFPDDLAATWTLVSGPGEATFEAATDPRSTVTFSGAGAYFLRLSAGAVSHDVTINVTAAAPTGWQPSATGWIYWDFFPWIFHTDHGYLYLTGENTEGLESQFAYYTEGDLGWIYLDIVQYPYLYSFGREAWLFYNRDEGNYPKTRWFWDFTLGDYIAVAPGA